MRTRYATAALLLITGLAAAIPAHAETGQQRLAWFREAKFGLFLHWGPGSLTGKELSWPRNGARPGDIVALQEIPVETYDSLYKQFNPIVSGIEQVIPFDMQLNGYALDSGSPRLWCQVGRAPWTAPPSRCQSDYLSQVHTQLQLFEWDKDYINPLYGQCRTSIDFPVLLSLYQQKRLKLDKMVTRTYPLAGLAEAFDHMKRGLNAKGVLIP